MLSAVLLLGAACQPDPATAAHRGDAGPIAAVCVLRPIGDSDVRGTIHLDWDGETTRLTGTIEGLEPGEHGFHVHEWGDLSQVVDGASAGGHYAPRGNDHGRPSDDDRHVGDLGNIEADAEGTARVDIEDDVITLAGPHSVLGRSIVVHAGADRFTQPTGDAGSRVAFGVIGRADASN